MTSKSLHRNLISAAAMSTSIARCSFRAITFRFVGGPSRSSRTFFWFDNPPGELPDYSAENFGIRKETPSEQNEEAGEQSPSTPQIDGTWVPPPILGSSQSSVSRFDAISTAPPLT